MRAAASDSEHVIVYHPFARGGGLGKQCLDKLGAAATAWSWVGLVLCHLVLLPGDGSGSHSDRTISMGMHSFVVVRAPLPSGKEHAPWRRRPRATDHFL
jgi:hypothetical protein